MSELPVLDFAETLAGLPKLPPDRGLDELIQKELWSRYDVVIVLDDDPTGTQTVYDVPVITELTAAAIVREIRRGTPLFYLLTNSRAISTEDIVDFASDIGMMIADAAEETGKKPLVILRGDSTLRGHYPVEDNAIRTMLMNRLSVTYLIPAFFEGGRYTINDIHYVREGDRLIPAGQTPFAKDATFGYRESNLRHWIVEKADDGSAIQDVESISIAELRSHNPSGLIGRASRFGKCSRIVVNAADYQDLKTAIAAILNEKHKNPIHLRTSASFIKALLGQADRPLLTITANPEKGGLIVVGSHVPKTTRQLAHLQSNAELTAFEVDVSALLFTNSSPSPASLAQQIAAAYERGEHVLLYTSRKLITVEDKGDNLNIAAQVSGYLETVIAALPTAPAFFVTKGGITSSRIATESLGVRRAMVLGQVQPGVPTWELGPESKFPGLPFIIFPGNVGGEDALTSILQNTLL